MTDFLRQFLLRFLAMFRRAQLDQDLEAEMAAHLELAIEDNLRSGMPSAEARRQALLHFGGIQQTKETHRDTRGLLRLETLLRDLRFGLRMLGKSPSLSAIAILTLALGIGVNTAIFSVVYASLLAPLPYPHPDQLVMVWSKVNGHNNSVSAGDFLDWRQQNSVFQALIAISGRRFSLSTSGHPESMQARATSPGFFDVQGIPLFLGRDFLPEEATVGNNHVVIMTHRLWLERFGGEPHILGQQLRLDGEPYTVVGVASAGMPDRFESQLFVPLAFVPDQINHDFHWLFLIGRLKPGVTLQQANADMDTVTRHIAETYPLSNKNWSATVTPLQNAFTSRDTITNLWLLMGAVGFVLLIACLNVSNLLLARGTVRQREVAIRASLGATRAQLFSQFLSESLALAFIGGIFGVALSGILLKAILALLPPFSIPTEADIRLNLPVLFFTLAASLLAGVLCGCAPAWQSSRLNLSDTLKEGGRCGPTTARQGLRRLLVIVEFALALTLLAGAGLVIHSFWKLTRVDLGFRQDHILTFVLPIRDDRFSQPEQITAFYSDLLERISALPGISSAAASTGAPIVGPGSSMRFSIVGQPAGDPASLPDTGLSMVTPDYFHTFAIQIVKGRAFTAQDAAGGLRVAVVNETFAKKYLSNLDPLAQRVSVAHLIPGAISPGPPIEWHIVGVYRNVHNSGVREGDFPEVNIPFSQSPWPSARIEVRTSGDPASITTSVASVVQSLDPDLPLDQVRTMDQLVDESLAGDRFATVFFAAFAAVALLLAAIGIYGVVSFAVSQRTLEIGLRMALGASPNQVIIIVLREGLLLALTGLLFGLIGTYFVGRTMQSVLYQVTPIDPAAIAIVAITLLLSAALATYIPARRATRVDPVIALRYQ
jgi:putative ABC transport system permease protein